MTRFRVPDPTEFELEACDVNRSVARTLSGGEPVPTPAQLASVPSFFTVAARAVLPGAVVSSDVSPRALMVVRGRGMIDVDAYPLTFNPKGRIQMHALPED